MDSLSKSYNTKIASDFPIEVTFSRYSRLKFGGVVTIGQNFVSAIDNFSKVTGRTSKHVIRCSEVGGRVGDPEHSVEISTW